VRELETEATEVNTLKQQVCELDAQLAANCNVQEVALATTAGMVYRKSRAKICTPFSIDFVSHYT